MDESSSNDKPPVQSDLEGGDPVYELMADKIGFVPNARLSDNVYQAKFIAVVLAVMVPIGALVFGILGLGPWWIGAVIGVVCGLLIGVFLSGTVLAIRNLKR
ncbi:MAG: hypothetical protein IT203_11325 [Fimbriimonadaceae bacterium]|nr:hypothetical protein [Fimbriimonadaceae bacterium]